MLHVLGPVDPSSLLVTTCTVHDTRPAQLSVLASCNIRVALAACRLSAFVKIADQFNPCARNGGSIQVKQRLHNPCMIHASAAVHYLRVEV